MFLKLLTIIFALCGGVKAPPPLHKQKQTNMIKETYVQRGDYDWTFYNRFNAYQDVFQNWNLEYNVLKSSVINIHNINNNTSQSPFLTLHINYEVGNTYFINWNIVSNNESTSLHSPSLIKSGTSIKNYTPFVTSFNEGDEPYVVLLFDDYNNFLSTDNFTFTINVIDLTHNPIPTFDDSMINLWTEKGVEEEVNSAIEITKRSDYPLYSMDFDYILSSSNVTSDIPLTFRGDDYTHIYKSDLYSAINSRVGSVSNNFTIKIWLPIKNMRDLNITAKGNNIKLFSGSGSIVYQYTQGNNIFDLTLPQDNRDFNFIELSFYDFNSINADEVILSVSNSVDFNSYQNGFDEGKKVGYEEGSKDGYKEGKENGIKQGGEEGFQKGFDEGKKVGFQEGSLSKGFNPFTMVSTAFESVSKLLSVNIFGGITIATLVSIPFIFMVVLFILKLIKG